MSEVNSRVKSHDFKRWLAEHGIDRLLFLVVPAFLAMFAFFIYPTIYGIYLSFHPLDKSGALGNYRSFFGDSYMRDSIWNTFRIALPVSLINVFAAVPLAVRLRHRVRGQRTINTLLVIPMSLGTVLVAEGLSGYLTPNGWLNRTLLAIGVISEPLQLLHTFWAVIISLLITGFPFAFLLTLSYISGINPKMEEAASTLGATPWQRFRYITFPLLTPGLAITFCLSFVLAFSVFPSANLLGNPAGDSHVLAVAAAQAISAQYDYSMASAISVITGALELMVVALVLVLRSRLYSGSTSGGKG
jgi:putative spermidine/putrescine transport system permease protein